MAKTVADRLIERMDAVGVNQKKLAIEAGLNETYIRDILTGRSKHPTADRLDKVFAALDRLGAVKSLGDDDTKPVPTMNGIDMALQSEDTLTEAALIGLWRKLEHPDDKALTFDLIDAAVRHNMRRRRSGE